MTIRGILFDKDGTLFDFFTVWVPAYREAAESVASRMDRADLLDAMLRAGGFVPESDLVVPNGILASGTTDDLMAKWGELAGSAWRPEFRDLVDAIFHEHASSEPKEIVPLAPLFAKLRERGMNIGIATMDATPTADEALRSVGAREYVDIVLGADAVEAPKPAPEMVEVFAGAVRIETSQVVMVGDSIVDLQMGRAAGVARTIGVLSGPSTAEDLAPYADEVVDTVASLRDADFVLPSGPR